MKEGSVFNRALGFYRIESVDLEMQASWEWLRKQP